jgi:hypothetical protein
MDLTLPFWFKMRQGKAEAAGEKVYRLTAPNLPETFIALQAESDGWKPVVRSSAEGGEIATGEKSYAALSDAWNTAFELFRRAVVV